jgi:hypothetical protein
MPYTQRKNFPIAQATFFQKHLFICAHKSIDEQIKSDTKTKCFFSKKTEKPCQEIFSFFNKKLVNK